MAQPVKYDNDSYVRDYSRCILCYKCVEACGEVAQNTFAIAVADRGFEARISTGTVPAGSRSATALTATRPSATACTSKRTKDLLRHDYRTC